jgi:4-amino-4-deoxy-L-arabinose transferase-like glycosyltransferase
VRAVLPWLGLLVLSIVVRLPLFFPAVIDHDESTYILVAQLWLDGHLPYLSVWEIKPPLLFGVFAGILALVGDSVPGIRLMGAMCVAVTAGLVYDIVRRTCSVAAAAWAAALCVVLLSVMGSGQATMSEHVMLPFLMGAVALWRRPHRSPASLFAMGGLLAAAVLVRPNAVVPLLATAGFLAVERSGRTHTRWMAFASGGVFVTALVCAPFVLSGHFSDLWSAAVVSAGARAGLAGNGATHVLDLLRAAVTIDGTSSPFWLAILLWALALFSVVRDGNRQLSVLLMSVLLSIVFSGGTYQHYFLQAVPFAALLAASSLEALSRRGRAAVVSLAVVAALVALQPVMREYRALGHRVATGAPVSYGSAYDIAAYLARENPDNRPVVLLTDHLAYWLLDAVPPSRFATHPTTLGRAQVLQVMGTSPLLEVDAMFAKAPLFVVMDPAEGIQDAAAQARLRALLASDYALQPSIAGRAIYRRVSTVSQ